MEGQKETSKETKEVGKKKKRATMVLHRGRNFTFPSVKVFHVSYCQGKENGFVTSSRLFHLMHSVLSSPDPLTFPLLLSNSFVPRVDIPSRSTYICIFSPASAFNLHERDARDRRSVMLVEHKLPIGWRG